MNRRIARHTGRETKRTMGGRPDAPWMYYFGEGGPVLGRLEESRVELTEFVKDARHGQGMTAQ